MIARLFCAAALAATFLPAAALTEAELGQRLEARFKGDRTGACVLAAVIDVKETVRARSCAQPRADGGPGFDAGFEIGSITKTMTALLVAQLIQEGRWSLDDPIEKHLPPGAKVPRHGERTILVRDLVTHSAGLPPLPPGYAPLESQDFYAAMNEQRLLDALARTTLRPPGRSAYSNFGMMILSLAVARATGGDLEAALRERLFEPLGMQGAHIARRPGGLSMAQGHLPGGALTAPWTITPNLAGMGMVRATLGDMERYAKLAAGIGESPLAGAMQLSQRAVASGMAMNWFLQPVGGQTYLMHGGATGGFAAMLAVHPPTQRAAVVLADTSLINVGGLHNLALRLLDADVPVERPRLAVPMSATMLRAMLGEYELGRLSVRVTERDGRVFARTAGPTELPAGQPELELLLDDRGDVYPASLDARLRPVIEGGQVVRFTWFQGGGTQEGVRKGHVVALIATNPAWKPWAGEYRVAPAFTLKIFERDGKLMLQGSGQPAFEAAVIGEDRIEVARFGAVLEFKRDAAGVVNAAVLRQGGQVLEGPRVESAR